MSPLVSILIPAYNAAPWIRESLASALAQTHARTEIIVVDDGSTDATAEIISSIAQNESGRIQFIRQSNAGASAARNHALRMARGEYLQFLDADDLLSPRKIELQLARLSSASKGAVATCRWGRFTTDPAAALFLDAQVFHDFTPIDWSILHASKACMMHPAAWLVPRRVAENAGTWNENLSLNDDGEYFCRVVIASTGIAFTPSAEASTYYRSNIAGSLSSRRSKTACLSLHRTGLLLSEHLLRYQNTPQTRQAIADHWQHLAYELYPDAPALSRDAEQHARSFGGSAKTPPLGPKTASVARLFGWRFAFRLRELARR